MKDHKTRVAVMDGIAEVKKETFRKDFTPIFHYKFTFKKAESSENQCYFGFFYGHRIMKEVYTNFIIQFPIQRSAWR